MSCNFADFVVDKLDTFFLVGQFHVDTSVKSAQKGWIQGARRALFHVEVGGSKHKHWSFGIHVKAVHFRQKTGQNVACVVSAGATVFADGINFVNEQNGWGVLACSLEQIVHRLWTFANVALQKLVTFRADEGYVTFASHCFGKQSFARSWRAVEQNSLWWFYTLTEEFARVFEVFDKVVEFVLGIARANNVAKVYVWLANCIQNSVAILRIHGSFKFEVEQNNLCSRSIVGDLLQSLVGDNLVCATKFEQVFVLEHFGCFLQNGLVEGNCATLHNKQACCARFGKGEPLLAGDFLFVVRQNVNWYACAVVDVVEEISAGRVGIFHAQCVGDCALRFALEVANQNCDVVLFQNGKGVILIVGNKHVCAPDERLALFAHVFVGKHQNVGCLLTLEQCQNALFLWQQ